MHFYTPIDFFRGIFNPLCTKNTFTTPDPPALALKICDLITPTDMFTIGAVPMLNVMKVGPRKWRAQAPTGMGISMEMKVEPRAGGSLVVEELRCDGILPGMALMADFVHSFATDIAKAYQLARKRHAQPRRDLYGV